MQPISNSGSAPVVDVGNVRYISNQSSRMTPRSTVEEFVEDAGFIFSGECISSEPVFQNDTLYTLSKIKISQVYKGNLTVGEIVQVGESGGRTTYGDYVKGCAIEEKAFEPEGERLPDDYEIVEGSDGYFPLKVGEQILLFAVDASGFFTMTDQPLYGILADYEGKFFLQDDGTYARPIPSQTDNHVFKKGYWVISVDELK